MSLQSIYVVDCDENRVLESPHRVCECVFDFRQRLCRALFLDYCLVLSQSPRRVSISPTPRIAADQNGSLSPASGANVLAAVPAKPLSLPT